MHLADEAAWEQELADHIRDPTLARAARGERVGPGELTLGWWATWARLAAVVLVLLAAGFLAGWYVI